MGDDEMSTVNFSLQTDKSLSMPETDTKEKRINKQGLILDTPAPQGGNSLYKV